MPINNAILLFIVMLFCHVIADYNLQGILASMKQKSWWINNPEYTDKYKYDYVPALICHSISWSFIVMLPLAIYGYKTLGGFTTGLTSALVILFAVNTFLHFNVDHAKANCKAINLCEDQLFHLSQIVGTLIIFSALYI